jgi:hypothetical protein
MWSALRPHSEGMTLGWWPHGERGEHPRDVQQLAPLLRDNDGHGEGGVRGGELAAHDEHRVDVAVARERRLEGVRVTVDGDSKPIKLTADGVKEFHSDKVTSKFERGDGAGHHAAVQGGVAPSARSSASARSSCSSPTRSSCHRVPEDQVHHPPDQEIWMLASIFLMLPSCIILREFVLLP